MSAFFIFHPSLVVLQAVDHFNGDSQLCFILVDQALSYCMLIRILCVFCMFFLLTNVDFQFFLLTFLG